MAETPRPIVVDQPVTITVNGAPVTAQKGELLIDACERAGTYIPRFCYHPRMAPVGMCRMCLVEVDTGRGSALQPSCMVEVGDGTVVDTQSERVKKAQDGVLEFLLINHPLDCPVCDKGGECPLQDTTMSFGPGESRWVEEKRHYRKPIPISATVNLDRERCILCDRCTRFADEVVGDPLIHFMDRGANTQVNTFPGEPFSSYFSGNTVQICPVGALTATPYRFKARPWDLEEADSTCTGCSVGCRITVQSSRDQLLRYNGVDSDAVNWSWLCDKGRYGFEATNSEHRLVEPLIRTGAELRPARWTDALDKAADVIRAGLARSGPEGFAVLGGARLTNESAYAWVKLAKGVIGSDNVDAQLGDGLPADAVLGLPRATIADACRPGGTVVLLGPDVKETLGVLFIRLKHAVTNDGVKLIELTPQRTGMTPYATASLLYRPGDAASVIDGLLDGSSEPVGGVDGAQLAAAGALLANADGPVTVVLGRPTATESAATIVDAASLLSGRLDGVRFLSALTRANVHGALDLGMAPALLPGRVRRADGAAWFGQAWPTVPEADGLDAAGILRAAVDGKIDTLVLLGADPLADFIDRELADRALTGARTVIAVDQFLTASSKRADVVLAASAFGETAGTTTNMESRVTILSQKVTPAGTSRPDWSIATDLAARLGHDFDVSEPAELWAEIEELSVLHAGATLQALAANATEGVVVPLPAPDVSQITEAAASEDESPDQAPTDAPQPMDDVSLVEAPEMVVFSPPPQTDVPAVDAYSLRLVAARTMYDHGTLVQNSPSEAPLAPAATLRLHPADHDKAGVGSDGRIRVTHGSRSIVITASVDASLPKGTAALVSDGTVSANELIDADAVVTEVRLEGGAMIAVDPLLDHVSWFTPLLIVVLKAVVAFAGLMVSVMAMVWFERKLHADFSNRLGPRVAGPFGILQTLADGVKLFFKTDLLPANADPIVFRLAPYLSLIPAFMVFVTIPIAGDFTRHGNGVVEIAGHKTLVQVADPQIGILFVLAMSSLAVYGIMLAGWSSGSKYPLLGSVRASAQMVSYEAALGLSLLCVLLNSGRLSTNAIVSSQSSWNWNLWATGVVPFVVFLLAGTAEMNRPPFDLVEAEQELVGGFNTEYSAIRFALFYLAEFMNVITMSAVIVTLFLGGPLGPNFGLHGWLADYVLPLAWFFLKVLALIVVFVLFRTTLPRLRYDQLMDFGWKLLIPLSLGWFLLLVAYKIADDRDWNPVLVGAIGLAVIVVAAGMLSAAVRTARVRRAGEELVH